MRVRNSIRFYSDADRASVEAIARQSDRNFDLNPGRSSSGRAIPVVVQLVACADDSIVGYLDGDMKLSPDPTTQEIVPVVPWEGYIKDMAVHPDYRRTGFGRKLLLTALEIYRKSGCVGVELGTGSDDGARFYESCGGKQLTGPDYAGGPGGSFYWKL